MAKAMAAALRDRGHKNGHIIARNPVKGQALAHLYGFDWAAEPAALQAPLLINATPLGMVGTDADKLAFAPELIAQAEIIFDVVALPAETPLLRAAKQAGRKTITGTQIGILQAVEQFVLYTGIRPREAQIAQAAHYAASIRDRTTP